MSLSLSQAKTSQVNIILPAKCMTVQKNGKRTHITDDMIGYVLKKLSASAPLMS